MKRKKIYCEDCRMEHLMPKKIQSVLDKLDDNGLRIDTRGLQSMIALHHFDSKFDFFVSCEGDIIATRSWKSRKSALHSLDSE